MTEPAILADRLSRRFGATLAVDALSLVIERGEVFGFLGHNGAGKTTTVRLLNGVLAPNGGTMRVLGLDPVCDGPMVRGRTGVLTETPALDDRLTARASLRFAAELFGVPVQRVEPRITELLETFGLATHGDQRVGGFSKGMRQRMALARTLIHDPELIFLDEPTAALDPVAARDVHQLIIELSRTRGRTIFLCTHNLVEAQRLCDRVAVLAHGRLLALGAPSELARTVGQRQRVHLLVEPGAEARGAAAVRNWRTATSVEIANNEAGALTIQGVAHDEVPLLVERLVAAGVPIYRIAPDEPTLEEVYLSIQDQLGDGVFGDMTTTPGANQ
jgi:ABC-2 type transport system ATP-binding protein